MSRLAPLERPELAALFVSLRTAPPLWRAYFAIGYYFALRPTEGAILRRKELGRTIVLHRRPPGGPAFRQRLALPGELRQLAQDVQPVSGNPFAFPARRDWAFHPTRISRRGERLARRDGRHRAVAPEAAESAFKNALERADIDPGGRRLTLSSVRLSRQRELRARKFSGTLVSACLGHVVAVPPAPRNVDEALAMDLDLVLGRGDA